MAETGSLILPIGADASQFKRSIQDVKDRIKELGDYINNKPFNLVSPKTKLELNALKETLNTLQTDVLNTANAFDKSESSTKKARTALTSLSLVAQDLPFGFIAIQNNLPGVISSFGELTKGAGGLKGALSQIGSALVGPAGLFLAFSVLTAATTKAVEKYGSLGAFLESFTGKTITAADAQNRLNKELENTNKTNAGEIANLESLVNILQYALANKTTLLGVQEQLNKQYPLILAGIKEENLRTAESIALINERTNLIKTQIVLEGRKQALIKLIGESAVEGEKALNQLTNRNKLGFFDKLGLEFRGLFAGIGGLGVINVLNQDLGNAALQSKLYNEQLAGVNKTLSSIIGLTKKYTDEAKKEEEQTKKSADAAKKLAKARAEQFKFAGDIRALRNQDFLDFDPTLKPIKKIDAKGYVESFAKSINEAPGTTVAPLVELLFPEKEFKRLSDIWSKINADTAPKLEEFKNNIRDALINKELTTGVKTTYDDVEKEITDTIIKLKDASSELQINDAINNYRTNITSLGEVYKLTFNELVEKNKELATSIQGFLYQPLENLFDVLLEKGKKSWKDFGNAVLSTLKRIAAQLAATFIAKGIANLLAPGLGSISTSALGDWLGQDFNDITGSLSMNNIRPGGMQMNGQVVFVQRGSDLVGVLNRTNATINRVG